MSGRGLLVLLLLVVLGLAVVLLLERGDDESADAEDASTLLRLDPADLTAIELQRAAGGVRLARAGPDLWRMTAPLGAEADARAVEALVRGVADARVVRELGPLADAGGLAGYGLAAPELVVTFARRAGPAVSVRVGGTSPVGSERYVTTGDGRLRLVDGEVARAVDQEAESLVERRLAPLEAEAIAAVRLRRRDAVVRLQRDGDDWRLTEPVADRADAVRADALARSLAELSVDRLARPEEMHAARRALSREDLVVEIATSRGAGSVEARFAGQGPDEGLAWATRGSRIPGAVPVVGVVPTTALEDLRRPPWEWRDRRLVRLSHADVRAIAIHRGARRLEIRRPAEGAPWTAGPPPTTAHPQRVQELLDSIGGLRALSFPDPVPALPPASARLTLVGASAELGTIEIFDAPALAPDRLARTTWRPGVLARVSGTLASALPADAAALARPPAP